MVIIPARTRCLPHHPHHHHRRALARHIGAMEDVGLTVAGLTVASLDRGAEANRHTARSPGGVDQDRQSPEGQETRSRGIHLARQVPRIHIYEQQSDDGTSTLTSINSNTGGGPHTNIVSVEQDPTTGQPVVDLVFNDPKLRDINAIASHLQSLSDQGAVRITMHALHRRKNKNDPKRLIPPWISEPMGGQDSIVPPPPQNEGNSGTEVDTRRSTNATQAPGNIPQAPGNIPQIPGDTSPVMANPPAPHYGVLDDITRDSARMSDSVTTDSNMPQEQPGDGNPDPLSDLPRVPPEPKDYVDYSDDETNDPN
ncbi:unnamed protein product, partial [Clonostachys solani]